MGLNMLARGAGVLWLPFVQVWATLGTQLVLNGLAPWAVFEPWYRSTKSVVKLDRCHKSLALTSVPPTSPWAPYIYNYITFYIQSLI